MNLQRIKPTRFSVLVGITAILLLMPAVLTAQERIAYTSTVDNNPDVWSHENRQHKAAPIDYQRGKRNPAQLN